MADGPQADAPPKDMMGFLEYYLVTKAPFQLPDNAKEFIVQWGPWITIVMLVLLLPPLLFVLGIGTVFLPVAGLGYGYLLLGVVIEIVLIVLALPGLFARIRIPGSEKHPAVLIDESAIGTDQAQKFVLTLTATNTVEYRPVKLGPAVNGQRIVREGLKPGEQIVVNGLARVRPGMPVQPQQAVADATKAISDTVRTAQR